MKPRAAWPGLLLGILACLGIIAAVAYARHEAEHERVRKAREAWRPLEEMVKKRLKKTL